MIVNFKCKDTELFFHDVDVRRFQSIKKIGRRKLAILDAAKNLNDLNMLPNNRLESMKGKRKGQFSIRINDQWRICFDWKDENAHNVEIIDYH